MNRTIHRITTESPIGTLTITATVDAIVAIDWDEPEPDGPDGREGPDGPDDIVDVGAGDHPVLDAAVTQLGEYFDGLRTEFDLPLDPMGTAFQRQAWAALREIPYGETITYGQQAERLGDKKKSRAVGAANGRNPIPIVVPCHRVVGSNGHLTGFAGGLDTKAWLLDHELRIRSSS